MSQIPSFHPLDTSVDPDVIETLIVPRARDLGGFEVRRALPAPRRQMVGPFIFFDQVGPAEFLKGEGFDVRPHPHIGLATVTYLLEGRIHHRDSLGTDSWIAPGAINLMVAGEGITHSERVDGEARAQGGRMFGLQTWLALPDELEDGPARFEHAGADRLPVIEEGGVRLRLMLGRAWGLRSPVDAPGELFHADAELAPGAALPLPDDHEDRGVHVLAGSVEVAGQIFEAGRMMVFRPGDRVSLRAGAAGARIALLGGATMPGPRHIWWNFVASSPERIEAAKAAWRAGDFTHGRFRLPPGESEHIPLP
ncbi:pirin family protein [Limimaricola sp.]|uniref:pirin family protein n=1 Tax=Limimaricola sp. TaxID=2211665 RepID=UPI0040595B70